MSAIRPIDLVRYFEQAEGLKFVDADTGKPILELLETLSNRAEAKSDYELWLDEQDESTKLEHRMREF